MRRDNKERETKMSDRSRSRDTFKIYKSVRKQMPREGRVINPKNLYDRHDNSWKNWDKESD